MSSFSALPAPPANAPSLLSICILPHAFCAPLVAASSPAAIPVRACSDACLVGGALSDRPPSIRRIPSRLLAMRVARLVASARAAASASLAPSSAASRVLSASSRRRDILATSFASARARRASAAASASPRVSAASDRSASAASAADAECASASATASAACRNSALASLRRSWSVLSASSLMLG